MLTATIGYCSLRTHGNRPCNCMTHSTNRGQRNSASSKKYFHIWIGNSSGKLKHWNQQLNLMGRLVGSLCACTWSACAMEWARVSGQRYRIVDLWLWRHCALGDLKSMLLSRSACDSHSNDSVWARLLIRIFVSEACVCDAGEEWNKHEAIWF